MSRQTFREAVEAALDGLDLYARPKTFEISSQVPQTMEGQGLAAFLDGLLPSPTDQWKRQISQIERAATEAARERVVA